MRIIRIETRDGSTYHCDSEDMLPVSSIQLIRGIATVDDMTPDEFDAVRAEEVAGRATFFGFGEGA